MNNTIIFYHIGLFIYIDFGYPGSHHDVSILQHSSIYHNWQQYFTHDNEYFELLLGDPRYMGEEMFTLRRIGRHDIAPNANMDIVHAYNKMHVCIGCRWNGVLEG